MNMLPEEGGVITALGTKPRMPKKMKDERKHGISHMVIDHVHDGSHHITHNYIEPMESTRHTAGNLEELHDHLEEHLGGKPTKAEMAEGEGHGEIDSIVAEHGAAHKIQMMHDHGAKQSHVTSHHPSGHVHHAMHEGEGHVEMAHEHALHAAGGY